MPWAYLEPASRSTWQVRSSACPNPTCKTPCVSLSSQPPSAGRPPWLPTLFVHRSLGRIQVPQLLRAAKLEVVTLAEQYGIPTDETITDVTWLEDAHVPSLSVHSANIAAVDAAEQPGGEPRLDGPAWCPRRSVLVRTRCPRLRCPRSTVPVWGNPHGHGGDVRVRPVRRGQPRRPVPALPGCPGAGRGLLRGCVRRLGGHPLRGRARRADRQQPVLLRVPHPHPAHPGPRCDGDPAAGPSGGADPAEPGPARARPRAQPGDEGVRAAAGTGPATPGAGDHRRAGA